MSGEGGPAPETLVVGTGLIGTSLGLALTAAGWTVWLEDANPEVAAAAAAMGAGSVYGPSGDGSGAGPAIGLVIVATPPLALAETVAGCLARFPAATVTDVGSVKGPVLAGLRERGADVTRYVGSHPMAGSHRSGPLGARADLFVDRTWVIAPHDHEDYDRTALIERVAGLCGSRVVLLSAAEHDVAVAQVSHLPQLISSLVAGRLNTVPYQHLSLAGQGIRDVTRIAASDPELWGQIVALNREAVRAELEGVQQDLADLLAGLDNTTAVRRVIARGREGVTGLPGKHGRDHATIWEPVVIEITDAPGTLARIFADATRTGVNVEDVAIEHDQVREVGYLTLSVDGTEPAARLAAAMAAAGWKLRA
ncbi:MAG: prephenate dehydrogenase [Propionibacteriaceae bacterium]|nr:prephenate dehydrogenase [Propionibacteriaceae bacterium]